MIMELLAVVSSLNNRTWSPSPAATAGVFGFCHGLGRPSGMHVSSL